MAHPQTQSLYGNKSPNNMNMLTQQQANMQMNNANLVEANSGIAAQQQNIPSNRQENVSGPAPGPVNQQKSIIKNSKNSESRSSSQPARHIDFKTPEDQNSSSKVQEHV